MLGSKLESLSNPLSASEAINDIISRQVQSACGKPNSRLDRLKTRLPGLEVNRRIINAGCGAINWADISASVTFGNTVVSGYLSNGGVRCQIVIGIALITGQNGLVAFTKDICKGFLEETAERCEGFGCSATCQILDGSDRSTVEQTKSISTGFVDPLGPCPDDPDAECAAVEVDA
ncbi:hypothetical protein CERZMDRAFT_81289 [Cercospora zeae-maydis SCOH1-5]|uniref:Uncharacterized protein n=1 Tax=Cercospora zeae-maydis SCOH1-5 TaxID=717836 RepID=A0A6A6FS69_9PEZI|nr:hypothetical protein CERZMDRAFT_81289 [Cercospora zeae-maydis SCOH1-5]